MKTIPARFEQKTKDAAKIYGIDWSDEIPTDSVSTATWSSQPSGLTFASTTITDNARKTNATISGGQAGVEYIVICKAVTAVSGETLEARVPLRVESDPVVLSDYQ